MQAAGFSLIELMIAMALGIIMIGGMIVVFAGNAKSADLSLATAQLQANARFAVEEISRDTRAAGYRGCGASGAGLISNTDKFDAADLAAESITGATIGAAGWSPAQPTGFTAPDGAGKPLVGTDALIVRYAAAPGLEVAVSMPSVNSSVQVKGKNDDWQSGDLMVLADCQSADVFEIDTISGPDTQKIIQPAQSLSRAYRLPAKFREAVRLMPLVNAIYYIGETDRVNEVGDSLYSLYLQTYPYDLDENPPIELIEGVDQMQLLFGVRSLDGSIRYMTADNVDFDPQRVNTVRVGLLLASVDPILDRDEERSFRLADTLVQPGDGAGTYDKNKRLRIPYNTTIMIRNRNLNGNAS